MNQKLLSSLTATLLVTTLGAVPSGSAEQSADSQSSKPNPETASTAPFVPSTTPLATGEKLGEQSFQIKGATTSNATSTPGALAASTESSNTVVKVGEQQSPTPSSSDEEAIARVHTHELSGRQAATLYVRNIPVLTFIGPTAVAAESVKIGTQAPPPAIASVSLADAKSLLNANDSAIQSAAPLESSQNWTQPASAQANAPVEQTDPVWRATTLAARLNQLSRDGVDASQITVSWAALSRTNKTASTVRSGPQGSTSERYSIKVNGAVLAMVDANTILPDTTRNLETDALQATNRLRRLLGDAAPLSEVTGKPRESQRVSIGPFQLRVVGLASWYGPGFHGNQSASGEIFNQHAMTAAHRSLPFGTRVLVTNLDNGLSVVVRINDRGPYSGNRIIDLSAGAASVLGLIHVGVAPVRLDVMNRAATSRN